MDSEEEVRRRRSILFKFAQQNVINSMRRKIDLSGVKRPIKEESWAGSAAADRSDSDRFAYTIPYKAEYQVTTSAAEDDEQLPTNDETDETETKENIYSDACSSVRSVESLVPNLPQIRPRRASAMGKQASSVASNSVMNFEQISTIIAPTEIQTEDHVSRLLCEDLKKEFFHTTGGTKL